MLGVNRQIEDCQRLAATKGWPVVATYVDDDISAYRGKVRPQYRQLLEDIRAGTVDSVLVWQHDRLHRSPQEPEEFFEVCGKLGVTDMVTVSGDIDLSSYTGMLQARILGAMSRYESDQKSARNTRKHQQLAQSGHLGGPGRAYGHDTSRAIIPAGAAVIREATRRVLAGRELSFRRQGPERPGDTHHYGQFMGHHLASKATHQSQAVGTTGPARRGRWATQMGANFGARRRRQGHSFADRHRPPNESERSALPDHRLPALLPLRQQARRPARYAQASLLRLHQRSGIARMRKSRDAIVYQLENDLHYRVNLADGDRNLIQEELSALLEPPHDDATEGRRVSMLVRIARRSPAAWALVQPAIETLLTAAMKTALRSSLGG